MGAHTDSTVQKYVPVRHCIFTSISYNKHLWLYLRECIGPFDSCYYLDLNLTWTHFTDNDVRLLGMM